MTKTIHPLLSLITRPQNEGKGVPLGGCLFEGRGRRLFSVPADRRCLFEGTLIKGGGGTNSKNYGKVTVQRNTNVFDSIDYLSFAAQRCTHK